MITLHKKAQNIIDDSLASGLSNNGSALELYCDKAWEEVQKEVPECTLHIFSEIWMERYNFQLRILY